MPQEKNKINSSTDSSRETNLVFKQQKSRGCLWIVIIIAIAVIVLSACGVISFLAVLVGSETSGAIVVEEGSADQIAVINVDGVISRAGTASLLGGISGAVEQDIVNYIESAVSDPFVKAIILRIESPGGEAVASDIISNAVLSARDQKPVIAYSSTIAASGGYMIASSADQFIVHPGTLTGSIGVIMQTSSMEGLYDKLGIETRTFKSDQFKDNEDLYDPQSDGELESIYQNLVDEAYDDFIEIIIQGRGMNEVQLRNLADGRIYSGSQAVENGLADSEGYFEDAVEVAENMAGISNATIVEYSDYGFFNGLLGATVLDQIPLLKEPNAPFMGVYYLPDLSQ